MNSKKISITLVAGAALLLAGCGSQFANRQASSSSSLIAAKTNDKVSQDNLTPQQTVALITAYAGNKFGGNWATTAKAGQQNGITVNLFRTSKYQLSDNGQGVAYNVVANGKTTALVYTVNGDDVTIYQDAQPGKDAKKLATVSRADMVKYINRNGQGQLVKNLATGAKVVDKTNGGLTSSVPSSTGTSSSDTGKYGNEGPIDVPSELQGTWYSADNDVNATINFTAHTYKFSSTEDDGDSTTLKLYKQGKLAEDEMEDQAVQDATKDWGRTSFMDVKGMHWMNIQGWCQSAGDGSFYAVHTETINGQKVKVLVQAGGADLHTDAVYYQSPSMAKQQADTEYDDLDYMD